MSFRDQRGHDGGCASGSRRGQEILKKALDSLAVPGFQVKISRVTKAGLDVCDFDVRLDAAHENHDHDMAYLYGNDPHGDGHGEHHEEHHHEHHHEHRGLSEILSIIAGADMTAGAKETAEKIFRILAEAEAKRMVRPWRTYISMRSAP